MDIKMITFQEHGDDRGQLIALETQKEIPFDIKRVYYMYETGLNVRRGYHAHKSLKQVLICIHGSCKIHLDDGKENTEVILDKPNVGLYVDNLLWREIYDFSRGAVLMVLASEYYDEKDYIRDYRKFIEYTKMEKK
ncbi:MAG: FdtA/QdtA family cupin domain-containing protein [Lachnospiraceae bacterium]|nr:FdtA/QdtA family cupin domain-containing protein [Lachnospiraceae bacterium]